MYAGTVQGLAGRIHYGLVIGVQQRCLASAKREGPVVVQGRKAVDQLSPRPDAELHGMATMDHRGVVLELDTILSIERVPRLRAASVERSQDLDGGALEVGKDLAGVPAVLESRFIDHGAEHCGLSCLQSVVAARCTIAARKEIETADARVPYVTVRVLIANCERMIGTYLIVQAGSHLRSPLRRDGYGGEGRWREALWV